MIKFLQNNWIYILFSILMIIIVISLILLGPGRSNQVINNPTAPSPSINSSVPYSASEPTGGKEVLTPQAQQAINQDQKVSELIAQMPFQGKNFDLSYDLSTNTFTLTLTQATQSEGNLEFDEYLKQNGISNRNSIRYLNIVVQ